MSEVFGNRNFRKLFFGNLFSSCGQGMTMIGIAWYLVQTTGTAKLLGSRALRRVDADCDLHGDDSDLSSALSRAIGAGAGRI
jgi:hypothetical protein